MSNKIVSLTALAAARAKMLTKGEAVFAELSRDVVIGGSLLARFAAAPDARGIVATHNAADVLIEVARAARVYVDSDAEHGYADLVAAIAKVAL